MFAGSAGGTSFACGVACFCKMVCGASSVTDSHRSSGVRHAQGAMADLKIDPEDGLAVQDLATLDASQQRSWFGWSWPAIGPVALVGWLVE